MGGYIWSIEEKERPFDVENSENYKFPITLDYEDLSHLKNFEKVPELVLHEIMLYFQPPDFVSLFTTCRYFQRVGMSKIFWKRYFTLYFRANVKLDLDPNLNHRKQFFCRYRRKLQRIRRKFFKIIIIGDFGVGKTSLILRYVFNKFSTPRSVYGVDFRMKEIEIGNDKYTLQIWDTSGQERFYPNLGRFFFRNTDACLLVFDLTRFETFESLNYWRNIFLEQVDMAESIPVVVVGNKLDLLKKDDDDDDYELKLQKKEIWCKKFGYEYFETSSKNNIGLQDVFIYVTENI